MHGQQKEKMTAQRNLHFATVTYPESAPDDWVDRLESQHIQALISPLHDKDTDSEGNQKKPHYHVILIFESLKSQKQVKEITDTIGGINPQAIHSLGAYSRYLCHIDNPEKAPYSIEDVKALSGADYKQCCRDSGDREKEEDAALNELIDYTIDNEITFIHKLHRLLKQEGRDDLLSALKKNAYYIHSIILSIATEKRLKGENITC